MESFQFMKKAMGSNNYETDQVRRVALQTALLFNSVTEEEALGGELGEGLSSLKQLFPKSESPCINGKLTKFVESLKQIVKKRGIFPLIFREYNPSEELAEACNLSGIDPSLFPPFSTVSISTMEYKVGYDGQWQFIPSLEELEIAFMAKIKGSA